MEGQTARGTGEQGGGKRKEEKEGGGGGRRKEGGRERRGEGPPKVFMATGRMGTHHHLRRLGPCSNNL